MNRFLRHLHIVHLRKTTRSIISSDAVVDYETYLEGNNKIGKANISHSFVGFASYVRSGSLRNCLIGKFCSIGDNVKVIIGNHPIQYVSTFPGFYKTNNSGIFLVENNISFEEEKLCQNGRAVIIGNDVWIGNNVTIMGGL